MSPDSLQQRLAGMVHDLSPMERSTQLGHLIKEARAGILKKAAARPKKGLEMANLLAATTDAALLGLFEGGSDLYPEEAQHMAVVAVGGYGRRTLAPYSDIDILILHGPYAGQKIKPLLDYVLYALWDAGLSVSQSVHSAASAVSFVREDLSGNTSFLDARFLCGNQQLFSDFRKRFEKHRKQTVSGFVEAKLEERDQRLTEDLASRYRTEPDVKEGKGGLRDLQTVHWLASYVHGGNLLQDHIDAGALSEDQLAKFENAREFLWSVRMQLHLARERADEKLTFDIQPEIARRLGYRDTERMPAAERLMKHYFLTAAEVGRLTRAICTNLEEAQLKKPRTLIPAFLGHQRRTAATRRLKSVRPDEWGAAGAFCMRGDRLDFAAQETLQDRPEDLFRLFRIAGRKPACDIHPDALQAVTETLTKLDKAAIRNTAFAAVFRAIIQETENPEKLLRDMAETGLLGRYIPIFGRFIGRVKYGLYRPYTLDEHVLKSVGVMLGIHKGAAGKEHPVATRILTSTDDVLPYALTVLLHEATEALPHLEQQGLTKELRSSISHVIDDEETIEDIIWTVLNYRIKAETAAQRNVMEASVVEGFCNVVGTPERLACLVVVTTCHLRVVGRHVWDAWTRRDLTVLYEAAMAWFRGGVTELNRLLIKRRESLRNKTARKLANWSVPELERVFGRLPHTFFDSLSPETAARFARVVRDVDQSSHPGASKVTPLADDRLEVIVYSRDKPGLYATIAGTIVSLGGIVRASTAFPVRAMHKGPDMAANIFVFHGEEGRQLIDETDPGGSLRQIEERFDAAISGKFDLNLDMLPRIGDRRATFDVPSRVTLDQDTSDVALIVEASGLDRPGLLYKLAAALSEVGVSIRSAYIATYGEMAVDTFYVQDLPGYKITDKRRQEVIKRKLLAVLRAR